MNVLKVCPQFIPLDAVQATDLEIPMHAQVSKNIIGQVAQTLQLANPLEQLDSVMDVQRSKVINMFHSFASAWKHVNFVANVCLL